MKKVELLAPAGTMDGFLGAIHAGADAVYLGGKKFGARAFADNFTEEELIFCIRYAHLWNKKVYLTLNTLMKDSEFLLIDNFFTPLYEAGLDGVIVQDIGLLKYLHLNYPDIELHASTQMTITSPYAANYLKKYGVNRIVPARELQLSEIENLKKETGLEMECFIHGAMCYCYSGQCLFSSFLGGRSGNRGRCAQPCRLPYRVKSDKNTTSEIYPLSLKDMCTIENVGQLIEAGIDSFKIEGRMKKPEYTAGVCAIYRKIIDNYYKDKNLNISKEDITTLTSLYLRSQKHEGYYFKYNGKDMLTLNSPSYNGSNEKLLADIRERFILTKPKMGIDLYAEFKVNSPAKLVMTYKEHCVIVLGDLVQKASKQPITEENIHKQLHKMGETSFEVENFQTNLDTDAFYSLKLINELRREACIKLENSIIAGFGFKTLRKAESKKDQLFNLNLQPTKATNPDSLNEKRAFAVSIQELYQLQSIVSILKKGYNSSISRLYVDFSCLYSNKLECISYFECLAGICDCFIALPYIIRQKDIEKIQNLFCLDSDIKLYIKGVMVRNLEGFALLKAINYQGKIVADAGFYIWNRYTLNEFKDDIDSFVKPYELHQKEKEFFHLANANCQQLIYGHIPMMVTANCVAKTTFGCQKDKDNRFLYLNDRYDKNLIVKTRCDLCMNIIYNAVPLSLHNMLEKINRSDICLISFTKESQEEVEAILNYYIYYYKKTDFPLQEFTTGHEKHGIE